MRVDPLYDDATSDALARLKEDAAALTELLGLDSQPAMDQWMAAVEGRLLPRLQPGFPLVAAICGGGSAGKSTLFNSLAGDVLSPTGGRAGINRRMLVALSAAQEDRSGTTAALFDPFDEPPQLLGDKEQLLSPGGPLFYYAKGLPATVALVDTPDFDTGAKGSYQNRERVEGALRAADVLIYIFTNANYNNRDNTDFIARMLTAVGTRRCFLVYRVDAAFSDQEVHAHADTVARNLYGDQAGQHVLGVYRADEDNRVADGVRSMTLSPLGTGHPQLVDALAAMDARDVRGELNRSIFRDVVEQAGRFLQDSRESCLLMELYLDGLRFLQQQRVREALGHLPMDAVVRRFSEIWQAGDPSHIRIMRKTGRVVEAPVRLMISTARWLRGKSGTDRMADRGKMSAAVQTDLIRAANRLRQSVLDPVIALNLPETEPLAASLRERARQLTGKARVAVQRSDTGTISLEIPFPPALAGRQAALGQADWSAIVDKLLARQEILLSLTDGLEDELQRLAAEQRRRLTAIDQIRQTVAAMLNIIPATAAVTYVLHTGDPVGAVGIKVKLAGIFGLNDLYALVAIPATAGMKKADLKQLEALLGPVAQTWLTHKLTALEGLFETEITATLLEAGRTVVDRATGRIASMENALSCCRHALETPS
ncbi:hypothetical protein DSCO28_25740 [Desulfosarcina ovata subsp. sediminis]|uniref:Uncharacterized protein n=1 Tax=Desulfosarcina ovata subsp. sediminis TaxID=885957 RepID=A0A5K7ZIG3_9BACT|nr:hypothetical protein DSCO28_25740 [Desulfosarcina ovata subsp. sediminis]